MLLQTLNYDFKNVTSCGGQNGPILLNTILTVIFQVHSKPNKSIIPVSGEIAFSDNIIVIDLL